MGIQLSDLDKLKLLWGEDKAIAAILTKVDKYCDHLEKSQKKLTSKQEERVKKFARKLIDEYHDGGDIDDKKYGSITSSLITLYPTGAPIKKRKKD